MAKENKILYKCVTAEDEDMIEYYMENEEETFNEDENKVFFYTFEVNPTLTHMIHRGYLLDDLLKHIENCNAESVYFDYERDEDKYYIRCEKGEIEGLHPKKRNEYEKIAIEVFNDFFETLNNDPYY